ncbi:MAG: M60 family peptidase N-terminal accessory domain-containing protein, partial [Rikenellaceae bacterium]
MKNRFLKFTFSVAICAMSMFSVEAQDFSKKDLALFANEQLTSLKSGTKAKAIDKMESPDLKAVAIQMLKGTYPIKERLRSYKCYLSPFVLAKLQKTSPYSQYENPTGIYFDGSDKAVLWVDNADKAKISLVVKDWGKNEDDVPESVYPLKDGYNIISIAKRGNSYIRYFVKSELMGNNVNIHIMGGKVNGFFDLSKDDNLRWNSLLDNAVSPVMDIVGKHTQLAYSVESLKREAYGKGV